jgi:hypothetical protein
MVEIILSPKTWSTPFDEVRIISVKISPAKTIENISYVVLLQVMYITISQMFMALVNWLNP